MWLTEITRRGQFASILTAQLYWVALTDCFQLIYCFNCSFVFGLVSQVPQGIILRNRLSLEPESASLFLDLLAIPLTQEYEE